MLEQWYWIMPNSVLFSKELTDKQKLLFCLVSSLCAEKWYCRASNEYLWELLNADARTIRRNLSALNDSWLLGIANVNNQRQIFIQDKVDKNVLGGGQKCPRGVDKNVHIILQDNNTIEEKDISKDISKKKSEFEIFWKEFPHARPWKKKECLNYFNKLDTNQVMLETKHLKWKIKAGIQDAQYIPACQRRLRDFVPTSDEIKTRDLEKIMKWNLTTEGTKDRYSELVYVYGEDKLKLMAKKLSSTLDFNKPKDVQI